MATRGVRVLDRPLTAAEKSAIAERCDRFIADVLKPRFLPAVRPSPFNYAVDLFGRWRAHRYSFITRYRSGFDHNEGEEFDSAFTRLDHLPGHRGAEPHFAVMWHRHTGQWFRLHEAVPLAEALRLIETDEVLAPPI
jgi:hypothetical protein